MLGEAVTAYYDILCVVISKGNSILSQHLHRSSLVFWAVINQVCIDNIMLQLSQSQTTNTDWLSELVKVLFEVSQSNVFYLNVRHSAVNWKLSSQPCKITTALQRFSIITVSVASPRFVWTITAVQSLLFSSAEPGWTASHKDQI